MKSNQTLAHVRQLWSCSVASCFIVVAAAGNAPALEQMQLDANRALWESHNISEYDLVEQIGCFCEPSFVRPALVSVRMDSIVSVVDTETLMPRSPADFLAIDAMFDRLQHALNTSGLLIEAEFNSTLGYPRFFRIDQPLLGDDEYSFTVSSFSIVPEPTSLALCLIALAVSAALSGVRHRGPLLK